MKLFGSRNCIFYSTSEEMVGLGKLVGYENVERTAEKEKVHTAWQNEFKRRWL